MLHANVKHAAVDGSMCGKNEGADKWSLTDDLSAEAGRREAGLPAIIRAIKISNLINNME